MEEAARLVQQEETQTQHLEKERETTYGKSNASIEQLVSDFGDIQLSTSAAAAAKTVDQDDAPTLQNQSHAQSEKEETGVVTIRLPPCVCSSPSDSIKPLVEEVDNPQQQLLRQQVKNSDSSNNNDSSSNSSSGSGSSSSELESSSSSSEEDNANKDSSEIKQNSK